MVSAMSHSCHNFVNGRQGLARLAGQSGIDDPRGAARCQACWQGSANPREKDRQEFYLLLIGGGAGKGLQQKLHTRTSHFWSVKTFLLQLTMLPAKLTPSLLPAQSMW